MEEIKQIKPLLTQVEEKLSSTEIINQYNENGKKHGLWKYYDEDGKLIGGGCYENGKEVGPWKTYWNNGKLLSEGCYKNGEKIGIWKYYDKNGILTEEKTY